jgi:hypothetical protein
MGKPWENAGLTSRKHTAMEIIIFKFGKSTISMGHFSSFFNSELLVIARG